MKAYSILAAAVMSVLFAEHSNASPADNKVAAISAMVDIFSRQDPSAVDRYFTSPYHQHNTHIPDGLDALKKLAQLATTWPGVRTTIHRALADGDLVVLQSEYWNLLNRHETAVAFDLFRFNKDGKIVEHWDALEPLTDAGVSGHIQVDGATEIADRDMTQSNRDLVATYIDEVRIKGNTRNKAKFFDARRYVDHQSPLTYVFGATAEDLAGRDKLRLSDLRYLKRHQSVAEGNFVFVQGEGNLKGDQIVEIYDLFRLQSGKIDEHWAVHQTLPPASEWANSNGPY